MEVLVFAFASVMVEEAVPVCEESFKVNVYDLFIVGLLEVLRYSKCSTM